MNRAGDPGAALDLREQFAKAIVGVSFTRRDGSFVMVNPAFARIFGYESPAAFIAEVPDTAALYAQREERQRVREALARDGEVRDLEVRMRRRDGELRWIAGSLVALDGGLVQAAVFDATEKRLARERELALQRLEHLVMLRFSEAHNLNEALLAAMRAICEAERWEAARYLAVDEERGVLRAGPSWSIPDEQRERYLEESRGMEYRRGQGLVGHVWQTGEPLWVPDIARDPRTARPQLAAVTGMRGSVVFPVHAEGRTIGVLIFDSREVRKPDEGLLRTLALIGGQIGLLVRRAQAEEALRESEARFRSLSQLSSDWFWETDAEHRFTSPPTRIMDITGFGPEHYIGKRRWEVGGLEPLGGDWSAHRAQLERRESFRDLELVHVARDGSRHYLAISGEPIRGADGAFRGYRGTAKDITARVRGEQALAASERKFRVLIEHGADAMLLYDRNLRMIYRSATAQRITGYGEAERLGGPFMDRVFEEDQPALQAVLDALLRTSGESAPFRCRVLTKSGRLRWIEGVLTNLLDEPAVGALVVNYRDIDERMRYESRIEYLANHDALTALPNRTLLRDRVEQAIAHARRTRGLVSLMYVDLDQFKLVNDSWGHRVGDQLLLEVAARLKDAMRDGDTVARLGGDEFVVLLSSVGQAGDGAVVARKIAAALAAPLEIDGRQHQVTASIGIAMYPEDGADSESLLQCADAAMYRAKEAGRNGYQYYSAEMGAQARGRVELETGLRQALERGELRLHYQPQVALGSGEVRGCEALMRWERPGRGLVSPAQFIPVAEDSGLIVPMGEWALRSACQEAAGWAAAGLGRIKIAVNLSARQFWQGSVVETVRAALAESALPADCLELEITESVVARDLEKVVKALEQLRRMGVHTTIDDFGIGYSSLAYLRTLPIQKLKIDRSFIQGIPEDREAGALVAEIVRLAHVLSLEVVAEGVETDAQAAFLHGAACEGMQGFLFSRQLPPAEFAALLRSGRRLERKPLEN
jgi:diguanylate cyclase (GGDEF)-like protein/PAS domain S-box-containing protein